MMMTDDEIRDDDGAADLLEEVSILDRVGATLI